MLENAGSTARQVELEGAKKLNNGKLAFSHIDQGENLAETESSKQPLLRLKRPLSKESKPRDSVLAL
jgi:hypothetical protein